MGSGVVHLASGDPLCIDSDLFLTHDPIRTPWQGTPLCAPVGRSGSKLAVVWMKHMCGCAPRDAFVSCVPTLKGCPSRYVWLSEPSGAPCVPL